MSASTTLVSRGERISRGGVRVTSPAPREVWESVLASDPNALVSQTPAWTNFVCRCGDFADASRLYELPNGRRFVVPLVRQRRRPTALAAEFSFSQDWGIGGIVAPGGVEVEDARTVLADPLNRRVARTSFLPNPLDASKWSAARPPGAVVVPRLAHVLDLEGGFERVWNKSFRGKTRRSIRKAEDSGLTVERDTSGRLVPVLYELFERSLERWAEQRHEPLKLARWRGHRRDSRRKFELMVKSLDGACRIWVAWSDGRAAAAIMVLQGSNAYYTRGVMDKSLAGPSRANYLLQKLAIEEACAAGCRFYHMGETGPAASLAHFKSQFGAAPYPYAEYHIERLPITALDRWARGVVKRLIGFRE